MQLTFSSLSLFAVSWVVSYENQWPNYQTSYSFLLYPSSKGQTSLFFQWSCRSFLRERHLSYVRVILFAFSSSPGMALNWFSFLGYQGKHRSRFRGDRLISLSFLWNELGPACQYINHFKRDNSLHLLGCLKEDWPLLQAWTFSSLIETRQAAKWERSHAFEGKAWARWDAQDAQLAAIQEQQSDAHGCNLHKMLSNLFFPQTYSHLGVK